jgi:hypothetical protein
MNCSKCEGCGITCEDNRIGPIDAGGRVVNINTLDFRGESHVAETVTECPAHNLTIGMTHVAQALIEITKGNPDVYSISKWPYQAINPPKQTPRHCEKH